MTTLQRRLGGNVKLLITPPVVAEARGDLLLNGHKLEPEAPQSVEEAMELALVEGLGEEPRLPVARFDRRAGEGQRKTLAHPSAHDDRVLRCVHQASLGSCSDVRPPCPGVG